MMSIDQEFKRLETILALPKICNLSQAKVSFFNSGYTENPVFSYGNATGVVNINELYKQVEAISDPFVQQLYIDKLDEHEQKAGLVSAIRNNSKEVSQLSILHFGYQSSKTVATAKKIIADMPDINLQRNHHTLIYFESLKERIRNHLHENGFTAELLISDDEAKLNHVAVQKSSGALKISRNYIADEDELTDILYHEVETHIRRYENGKRQKFAILAYGTKGYLAYEEGLATLTGHAHKQNKNLWHPALLAFATHIAQQADFATVFSEINDIITSPFRSWSYAVRVKRGLVDTAQPGGITNDLYLQWLINAGHELLEKPELLLTAYNGKASFSQLDALTKSRKSSKLVLTTEHIKNIFRENYIV